MKDYKLKQRNLRQNPNLPDLPQNFRTSSVGGKGRRKKKWNALARTFETINVIEHKKSVIAWHPPVGPFPVEIVEKWTLCQGVLGLEWLWVLRFRVVCVWVLVSIEFKIQEQKRAWELCSDFVCIEVVLLVLQSWAYCYLSCSWKQKTKKWRMTLKKCALQDSHDLVITSFWRYDLSLTWREDGSPFDLHIYV